MNEPKATYQVKSLLLTEATEAWLEAEQAKNPTLSPQEIIRIRLHEIALGEIRSATVLLGIAARLGIRSDGA